MAEQLKEPAKKEKEGILPSHFVISTKPVAKPTFNQKREVLRLRELSMKRFKEAEFDAGWRRVILYLQDTSFGRDFPEVQPDAPNLLHPLYWRALGFSAHEPNTDFQKYEEPIDGRGVVCAEDEFVGGRPSIKPNRYKEQPLSPLTSRFRGGILTQECMLFFLERHPQVSRVILERRRRGDSRSDALHYNFAFVAMEVTRVLAIMFHMLLTRVQEPPNFPLQPDMHVSVPFDVDYVDRNPLRQLVRAAVIVGGGGGDGGCGVRCWLSWSHRLFLLWPRSCGIQTSRPCFLIECIFTKRTV